MPKTFEEFNNKLTALFTLNCPSSFFDSYNVYGDCLNPAGNDLVFGRVYGSNSGDKLIETFEEPNEEEIVEETTEETEETVEETTDTTTSTTSTSSFWPFTGFYHDHVSLTELLNNKWKYTNSSIKDTLNSTKVRYDATTTATTTTTPKRAVLSKKDNTHSSYEISFEAQPVPFDITKNYFEFSINRSYFELSNVYLTAKNTIMFSFKLSGNTTSSDICLGTFTSGSSRISIAVKVNVQGLMDKSITSTTVSRFDKLDTSDKLGKSSNKSSSDTLPPLTYVTSDGLSITHVSGKTLSYVTVLERKLQLTNLFNNKWHNVIISLFNSSGKTYMGVWLDGSLLAWKKSTDKDAHNKTTFCELLPADLTGSIIRFGDDRYYVEKGQTKLNSYAQCIKNIRVYADSLTTSDKDLIKIFSANNETIIQPDGTLWTKSIGEHIPRTKLKETPLHEIDSRNGLSNNSTLRFWTIDEWGRNEESGEESGVSYEEQLVLYDEVAKIKKIGEY